MTGNNSPDCNEIADLLSPYLDGRLDEKEKRAVDGHLSWCSRCADDLETLRLTVQALQSLPTVPVPRPFTLPVPIQSSVSHNASRIEDHGTPLRLLPHLRNATAALAAIFLVMIVASLYLQSGSSSPARSAPSLSVNAPTESTRMGKPEGTAPEGPAAPRPSQPPMAAAPQRAAPAAPAAAPQSTAPAAERKLQALESAPTAEKSVDDAAKSASGQQADSYKQDVPSTSVQGQPQPAPQSSASEAPRWPLLGFEVGAFVLLVALGITSLVVWLRERRSA